MGNCSNCGKSLSVFEINPNDSNGNIFCSKECKTTFKELKKSNTEISNQDEKKDLTTMEKINIFISLVGSVGYYYIGGNFLRAFGLGEIIVLGTTIFSFFVFYGFLTGQENKRQALKNLAESDIDSKTISKSNEDSISKLKELKKLKDDGVLTEEEFTKEKKKVLN